MKNKSGKLLMVLTVVTVLGFGAYAFADWGSGYGSRGWGHMGRGGHMGWVGPGYGYGSDLSEDQYKKIDEEQRAFFKATENLRQGIYEKELALEQELAKENPDAQKAKKLNKELAELETQLEQKQLDHQLNLRKIDPRAGRGYMGRGGMMGYGPGGMMGYGPGGMMMGYGPGNCWQ